MLLLIICLLDVAPDHMFALGVDPNHMFAPDVGGDDELNEW
jgi:hypothetical protein